jgi:hypothetical protein
MPSAPGQSTVESGDADDVAWQSGKKRLRRAPEAILPCEFGYTRPAIAIGFLVPSGSAPGCEEKR